MPLEDRITGPEVLLSIVILLCLLAFNFSIADAQPSAEATAAAAEIGSSNESLRDKAIWKVMASDNTYMADFIELAETGSLEQKRGALFGLSIMPNFALAQDTYLAAISSQDKWTRGYAAVVLSERPDVAERLVRLLTDERRDVRLTAASCLQLMKEKAIPALLVGLTSDNIFTRGKSAWLLGRLGPLAQSAIPDLIMALDVESKQAMHVIAEAIDLIGPDPETAVHHLLLIGLKPDCPATRIGSTAAPTLIRLLNRPGTPTGQLAFRALAIAGPGIKDDLAAAVHQGPIGQRTAAALLLVGIDPEAVRELPEDVRQLLAGVRPPIKQ